jgi:hypothetical protein
MSNSATTIPGFNTSTGSFDGPVAVNGFSVLENSLYGWEGIGQVLDRIENSGGELTNFFKSPVVGDNNQKYYHGKIQDYTRLNMEDSFWLSTIGAVANLLTDYRGFAGVIGKQDPSDDGYDDGQVYLVIRSSK